MTHKLKDAVGEMIKLMNEMPEADKQFEMAKEALLSKMESERLIKTRVFWSYLNNMDKGLDYDIRKDIYETIKGAAYINAIFIIVFQYLKKISF